MGKTTIEWTATYHRDGTVSPGYTFNPWIGCAKVSPGCKNCYAQTLDHRWSGGHWGITAPRKQMAELYWQKPVIWNRKAMKDQQRKKVFCASMADVFEDHPAVLLPRQQLFQLIINTPWLDWLILTKRPENVLTLIPVEKLPSNVWLGTSVENQQQANQRIPILLSIEASIHFLSMEPLLSAVSLQQVEHATSEKHQDEEKQPLQIVTCLGLNSPFAARVDWVIVGGESGHKARPMHPDWVRSIRDQCAETQTPFFFKQWGDWIDKGNVPDLESNPDQTRFSSSILSKCDSCRSYSWNLSPECTFKSYRVGKKVAGRYLDGFQHHEFPFHLKMLSHEK